MTPLQKKLQLENKDWFIILILFFIFCDDFTCIDVHYPFIIKLFYNKNQRLIIYFGGNLMFYSTIMKIDSIDRLRDIRDALLVEQGINPTRQGEQAIKVVVERIDEIQATLDKSATKNLNRRK